MRLSYIVTDYGLSWFEDQAFIGQYRRLCPDNDRSANRKYFLRSLLKLADRLPGDAAECGVYEGASSWFICDHFRNSAKVHHAFDSFEGLSKPATADGHYWQLGNLSTPEERARAGEHLLISMCVTTRAGFPSASLKSKLANSPSCI